MTFDCAVRGWSLQGRGRRIGALVLVFFGRASFLRLERQQPLPVGDRDLVIVRMDFAERQKTVPAATVFHKSRLEARLHADDFR